MPVDPVVEDRGVAETDEGAQELDPRRAPEPGPEGLAAKELLREVGCVLRLSEAEAAELEARPARTRR